MNAYEGYAIITDPFFPVAESKTYSCCHCQYTVHVHFGSGKKRGYCPMCNAPTCGGPRCVECVPFMKKIEAMENKARLHRIIQTGVDNI